MESNKKNDSPGHIKNKWRLSKGRTNEALVAKHLEGLGWEIVYKNKRFYGVEADLIAKKNKSYILVEVKSLNHLNYLGKILSQKQKQRLQMLTSALITNHNKDYQLLLATVNPEKEIRIFLISLDPY